MSPHDIPRNHRQKVHKPWPTGKLKGAICRLVVHEKETRSEGGQDGKISGLNPAHSKSIEFFFVDIHLKWTLNPYLWSHCSGSSWALPKLKSPHPRTINNMDIWRHYLERSFSMWWSKGSRVQLMSLGCWCYLDPTVQWISRLLQQGGNILGHISNLESMECWKLKVD